MKMAAAAQTYVHRGSASDRRVMLLWSEDSVSKSKYEHGKHVRDMDRIERLSVARTGGPPTEPNVNLAHSVAEILDNHVTFQHESIDRMYLNIYVPSLHYEGGVAKFFRSHRDSPFLPRPSSS